MARLARVDPSLNESNVDPETKHVSENDDLEEMMTDEEDTHL